MRQITSVSEVGFVNAVEGLQSSLSMKRSARSSTRLPSDLKTPHDILPIRAR